MPADSITINVQESLATVTRSCHLAPNYLDWPTVTALAQSLATLTADPAVRAICLQGQAENFLLGVDLAVFVQCIASGEIERILNFTRAAHELLAEIERSPKPVAAWVRGGAIGGGLELALACQRIVAAPNAKFALPETGLGIYPGMGGTQRLPRRIGVGLAKWMIYTGAIVPSQHALEIGLVDAVHPTATTAAEALQAIDSPNVGTGPRSTRFQTLDELFARHDVATLCSPSFALPIDPQAVRRGADARQGSAGAAAGRTDHRSRDDDAARSRHGIGILASGRDILDRGRPRRTVVGRQAAPNIRRKIIRRSCLKRPAKQAQSDREPADKSVGDCPDFAESPEQNAEQNGTVPLLPSVLSAGSYNRSRA